MPIKNYVEFTNKQVVEMAQYISELTKQGVVYEVETIIIKTESDGWRVTVTGY